MSASSKTAPLIETVDFSTIAHTDPKKGDKSAGLPICYSRKSATDNSNVTFQVAPAIRAVYVNPRPDHVKDDTKAREEGLAQLPFVRSNFHLQADPKYEEREGEHRIFIGVPEHYAEHVQRLDKANVSAVLANAEKWFKKKNLNPALIEAQYKTLVTRYPFSDEVAEENKTTIIRTKVIDGKTEILVQNPDNYGKFYRGTYRDLRMFAKVIPVLEDRGIYFKQQESGGRLFVKRIFVMHGDFSGDKVDIDTGGIDIEIEEDFEPQQVADDAAAPAAPSAAPVEKPGAAAADATAETATEQTVVNWDSAPSTEAMVF